MTNKLMNININLYKINRLVYSWILNIKVYLKNAFSNLTVYTFISLHVQQNIKLMYTVTEMHFIRPYLQNII